MLDYKKLYNNLENRGDLVWIREEIVKEALKTSVKKAAKSYNVGEKTIKEWIKRYQSNEGLADRSRAPKTTPHKMDEITEHRIVKEAKFLIKHGK